MDVTKSKKTTGERKISATFMVIRVNEGRLYTDVMGKLRTKVNPETSQMKVLCTHPTQKGEAILRVSKDSNRAAFAAEVEKVVGDPRP